MATLRFYNDIVNEQQKLCMESWGEGESICYKDIQEFLAQIPEDDQTIDIRLHCRGGDCCEGWAMYDALRRSGKSISATVEGECSSMATIILLAAPLERRSAMQNVRICIHNPEIDGWPYTDCPARLTADNLDGIIEQLKTQSKTLREEQERILDLYVERTGANRKALQSLMDKDTYIDAERAQELGFISAILTPTTASKTNPNSSSNKNRFMARQKTNAQAARPSAFARFLNRVGIASIRAQVVTAANGDELTVEREDGDPQVGDVAYPDGSYVLDDGTTIVVEGELITAITEPAASADPDPDPASTAAPSAKDIIELLTDPEEIRSIVEELSAKLAELDPESTQNDIEQTVAELQAKVAELEATIQEQTVQLEASKAEAEQMSAQIAADKPIVDKVNAAGGMNWLDHVLAMSSTFNPSNRRFVTSRGSAEPSDAGEETKTQKALRERREAAARKRAARQ